MAKNVLIVDDSGVMRKMVARSLRQAGLAIGEIYEGGDGNEGLKQLEAHPDIGLILSDWNMPNMDGLTFVKTARSKGIQTPVVMITTEATESRINDATASGANGYICKPFTPEMLEKQLSKFFT